MTEWTDRDRTLGRWFYAYRRLYFPWLDTELALVRGDQLGVRGDGTELSETEIIGGLFDEQNDVVALNRGLMRLLDLEEAKGFVRHELAHAAEFHDDRGEDGGHNVLFQAYCVDCGHLPEGRCRT